MPLQLKIVTSSDDKDAVFQLRHQVFVQEERRFKTRARRVYDFYDSFDETVNVLAYDGDLPVGCIRLTLPNKIGFPADEYYDFTPYMDELEGKCACLSWLCTLNRYRRHPGLIMGLFKMAVREMKRERCRHIIATIHPPLMHMLEKGFGARTVDNQFFSEELNVSMLPIHLDTENVPPGACEPFKDPPNPILDESMERRIYSRKERIFSRGAPGTEAFYIMRGSVRVVSHDTGNGGPAIDWKTEGPLGPGDQLLGKGQIFGIISLLDRGPRVTTALPYSSEVDVMVWTLENIMGQLQGSATKTLRVIQSVGSRLRNKFEGLPANLPEPDIARILYDATGRGKDSVRKDWLSRQCGLWPHELNNILLSWQESDAIAMYGNTIVVTEPRQLFSAASSTV